jgi:hypothetical protein
VSSAPFARFILAMIFAFAAYRTFSRAGWFLAAFAALCFYAFHRRALTRAFYITMMGMLGTVMLFSGYIVRHSLLNKWSDIIIGNRGAEFAQATNLSTMNARLEGFSILLSDSSVWTPFGAYFSGRTAEQILGTRMAHDAFTMALLKYGYIPMVMICLFLFLLVRQLHRIAYQLPRGLERSLVVTCLGCFVALLLGTLTNGAALINYPVNFFLYFYLGIVVGVKISRDEANLHEPEEELEVVAPSFARRPRAPGGNRIPVGARPGMGGRPYALQRE